MPAGVQGFQPGQSGNPGGRPKGLARATREKVQEAEIVGFWKAIMDDPTEKTEVRLAASKLIAERGWGKPAGFTLIDDDDPLGQADEELNVAVERFQAEVVRLADRRGADGASERDSTSGESHPS